MAPKGLLLAGGTGSRLFPLTQSINKHLLPIYDKPMIYYPLTTLMLCDINEVVVVSSPESIQQIENLLRDGAQWGISIEYAVQENPGGIAECLKVSRKQIANRNVVMILGDNLLYGAQLPSRLKNAIADNRGATILGYPVADPEPFGVVVIDENNKVIDLEEKPEKPRSNLAIPGFYCYDERVVEIAESISPSSRGELEITDVNRRYLELEQLDVLLLGRGVSWLDGGSHVDLFEAAQFVKVIEDRAGLKVACPEEVALRRNLISVGQFEALADAAPANDYGRYLRLVLSEYQ